VIGAVVGVPLVAVTWKVWTALKASPPRGDERPATDTDPELVPSEMQ
jgi:hypothetical protein